MVLSNEYNESLKQLKVIPIKPFRHIRVGDPYYFEDLDREKECPGTLDKKTKKTLESMVLDTKTSCCKNGVVVIGEIESDLGFRDEKMSTIEMNIILSCREDFDKMVRDYEVYATNRHYKNAVKKTYELGCDTARFDIEIDGNFEEVDTGADGFYGYALEMKQYYGFAMGLQFDGGLFTMKDVEDYARYLFKVDKKKETSPEIEQITNRIQNAIEFTKEESMDMDR